MGGYAWVTLATNDSYSLGALVLANSLRQLGTAHQLAVLVTPGVTSAMREKLGAVFDVVREVNILDSKDEANLRLLKRPELGITFTKLHSWRLTQFDKCVFLDADTLVLENADELFEREELSAAPDVGWPDCFNSGVFVYRPSEATYEKLVQFALDRGSFDGGDQGLLNLFFSDWAHKDISKHLPFIYNMCSTACYSYLPAFKQFGGNVKIVHFIGPAKPWLQYFDTESRQVHPTPDLQHLQGVLQRWWDIFFALIQPQLSTEMARSQSPAVHYHLPPPPDTRSYHSQYYDSEYFNEVAHTDYTKVWDPWEHYEPNTEFAESEHANVCNSNYSNNNVQSGAEIVAVTREPFESQNTKAHHVQPRRSPSPAPQIKLFKTIESHQVTSEIHSAPVINQKYVHTKPVHVSVESAHFPIDPFHVPVESVHVPVESVHVPVESVHVPVESVHVPVESSAHIPPNTNMQAPVNPNPVPIPDSYRSSPALPNEFEPTCTVANECTKHDDTGPINQKDAGLAAAFSQLKLGEPRSPGQLALEDNLRRQGWEVGNIDYLGKDSFDNIWKKIQQTIDSAPPQPPSKPRESSPPTSAPAPVGQDDEARKAKQKSPPKEQAPQETPSTTPATGDAPATPNAEVVAAVPATETPKAEPVEAPKPAVEIPKAETEPPKIEPAPIPEAPKTAAVEAPKVEAVEAPKTAPEAVQPVPLPEAPKTDVESPKVEAESPKPEPVEVPTSAAIPESPAQPAPVLETPKTEVAQVEPETSKTEPVTDVAPASVPESLKEEPTQLAAAPKVTAEAPKVEGEGTKPAETPAPTLESPKPDSVPESPKTEAPKPAPESPKTEAPKPAPESPKTEAPKPAPESPKTEASTPVPESPKAEAPKTAPESPKTEAPTPVPESPKAEAPTPVPESPKAEAPKAAPESPKTEAPKPAPESPKAEAPKPAPEAPKTEVPKPAPEGPKTEVPKPAPESPKTETAKPAPVPESPKTEASKPEAQASKAEATKEVSKPKEESKIPQPKGAAEVTPKASPASPTSGEPPSPTPPPRKASGGAKKGPKGKK